MARRLGSTPFADILPSSLADDAGMRACAQAGARPFGLHTLWHKDASIAFEARSFNVAQGLMGHRATTTDRYIRSAALYSRQDVIADVLGGSEIVQAAEGLLEKEMPQEVTTPGANCKRRIVNRMLQ